jgi:hypothetical protein
MFKSPFGRAILHDKCTLLNEIAKHVRLGHAFKFLTKWRVAVGLMDQQAQTTEASSPLNKNIGHKSNTKN